MDMDYSYRLSLALRGPYTDKSPPLLQQLFLIQQNQSEVKHAQVATVHNSCNVPVIEEARAKPSESCEIGDPEVTLRETADKNEEPKVHQFSQLCVRETVAFEEGANFFSSAKVSSRYPFEKVMNSVDVDTPNLCASNPNAHLGTDSDLLVGLSVVDASVGGQSAFKKEGASEEKISSNKVQLSLNLDGELLQKQVASKMPEIEVGCDDDFEYPLLSPLESKAASPSAAVGVTWDKSTNVVAAFPSNQRNTLHAEQEQPSDPMHSLLPSTSFVNDIRDLIREEMRKAAAIEFQSSRLASTTGMSGRVETDGFRDSFSFEIYRLKQHLQDLKKNPPRVEVHCEQSKNRNTSIHFQGDRKMIGVQVVKDYEEEPVPYLKQNRPPSIHRRSRNNSFQSPIPIERSSFGGATANNSIQYSSSFDTFSSPAKGNRSCISDSVETFVSEPID